MCRTLVVCLVPHQKLVKIYAPEKLLWVELRVPNFGCQLIFLPFEFINTVSLNN